MEERELKWQIRIYSGLPCFNPRWKAIARWRILSENKTVLSKENPKARKYLHLPFYCDFTSYGNNVVTSVSEELFEAVKGYLTDFPAECCCEASNLFLLMKRVCSDNCFMAEYFLPDVEFLKIVDCGYEIRILEPQDFRHYYLPQWENALSVKRKEADKLAVGVFDGKTLVGLAGCSDDCDTMWQIGVDVLPGYRKQGIASVLTSRLTAENRSLLLHRMVQYKVGEKCHKNRLSAGMVSSNC